MKNHLSHDQPHNIIQSGLGPTTPLVQLISNEEKVSPDKKKKQQQEAPKSVHKFYPKRK